TATPSTSNTATRSPSPTSKNSKTANPSSWLAGWRRFWPTPPQYSSSGGCTAASPLKNASCPPPQPKRERGLERTRAPQPPPTNTDYPPTPTPEVPCDLSTDQYRRRPD